MGLFGKKKPEAEQSVETQGNVALIADTQSADAQSAFSDADAFGNDMYGGFDGMGMDMGMGMPTDAQEGHEGVTGETIINALHKSDQRRDAILGAVGNVADSVSDMGISSMAAKLTEQRFGLRAKVLAFFGAGGGVGTSTMLLEQATRLAAKHKRVLVIDLNVLGGICEMVLRCPTRGKKEDLFTLFTKTSDLNNTLLQSPEGVSTLGFRSRGLDTVPVVDTALFGKVYDALIAEVSGGYDFILVDCGSEINYYLAVNALYRADAGYLVTDGGLSSIQKLGLLRTSFRYCGILAGRYGIIANKNTRSIASVIKDLDYRLAGEVPYLLSIKNANLQAKLLRNDFIYAESQMVNGAKATFDAILEEIITPIIPAIDDSERKQPMEMDNETEGTEE